MSVDRAKEFLLDAVEDEAVAADIQNAYLNSLIAISSEHGYELTVDDLSIAIEQMSGLDDTDEEPEVEEFAFAGRFGPTGGVQLDSLMWVKAPSLGVIANPLGLGRPLPGRRR
jgi:hypothetical protein